ncbi:DUF2238 domain-containing protein [Marinobacterium stanieri]|uniref:DUF2238 domain-containing protein n=1 Tax=Marinobacterium stanieri TaxID=49186 RepID=UPI003A8CF4EA
MFEQQSGMKYLWGLCFLLVLVWSAIEPRDRLTWWLEVAPALAAAALLLATRRAFPLTPLLYALVLAHCVILMVGGHYTYAEVPLFDGLWGAERNNYDKLGHFFQGFVPAIAARELLLRFQVVNGAAWRNMLILSFCLGFSAFYELIEWWVALLSGEGAEAFLGTQGYVWDTQSDMGFALLGASLALLTLSRWHDRQLGQLRS